MTSELANMQQKAIDKINEAFKGSYQEGFHDGMHEFKSDADVEYQRGLEDMLESALYILDGWIGISGEDLMTMFGTTNGIFILRNTSPQEVVSKVEKWKRAHEKDYEPTLVNAIKLIKEGKYSMACDMLEIIDRNTEGLL